MGLQRLAAPPVWRPGEVVPDAVWSKGISHPGIVIICRARGGLTAVWRSNLAAPVQEQRQLAYSCGGWPIVASPVARMHHAFVGRRHGERSACDR